MSTKITKFVYVGTRAVPSYGDLRIEAQYSLDTITEGIINRYSVTLELRGLSTAEPFFDLRDSEPHTNNEHTLTQDAVSDLIYDYKYRNVKVYFNQI